MKQRYLIAKIISKETKEEVTRAIVSSIKEINNVLHYAESINCYVEYEELQVVVTET